MNRRLDALPLTVWDNLGFRYELPHASEPIAFHLAIDGVYEPETRALMFRQLHRGDVFVDVGANIGVFTIPAARCVGNNGRVVAAEASSEIFAYLTRNVEANGASQVITVNSAICDFTGTVRFYPAPKHKFGMGSLGKQFDAMAIEVPARTLDEVLAEARIEHVDILKVDVEGFEAGVFKGGRNLLTGARPPLVVFEFCDWAEARVPNARIGDAQRLLLTYGYSIWRLTDFLRGGRPLREPLENNSAMLVASRQWRSPIAD